MGPKWPALRESNPPHGTTNKRINKMKYRGALLSILTTIILLTAFALPARAGWLEVARDSGTMSISGALIKVVPADNSRMWTIMDMNKGIVTMVDERKRTYTLIDPEKFCATVTTMMGNMMAGMTPQQRAMMKQMMGGSASKHSPVVKVMRMGSGGKVAGYDTTKYSVIVDGRPYKDVWLATNAPIMHEMKNFIKKSSEMSAKMESCSKMAPGMNRGPAPEVSKEYEALSEKGWPMKELNRRTHKVTKEVRRLERKTFPASTFRVPAGYQKVEMRKLMGGGRR